MLRLEIRSPLPGVLGISDHDYTVTIDYPFQAGMTLAALIERLWAEYPVLAAKKQNKTDLLQDYLWVVNGKMIIHAKDRQNSLEDNSVILMIAPYLGG